MPPDIEHDWSKHFRTYVSYDKMYTLNTSYAPNLKCSALFRKHRLEASLQEWSKNAIKPTNQNKNAIKPTNQNNVIPFPLSTPYSSLCRTPNCLWMSNAMKLNPYEALLCIEFLLCADMEQVRNVRTMIWCFKAVPLEWCCGPPYL